jgi:dynein heavy chain
MISTAQKVKIYFTKTKAQNQPQKLAENVLNNLKEFQKHIPLIRVFSNRGLKERHWDEIS